MFESKSDLSGGLETAEEEDFGPGKFAKHQKVCIFTCLQTISQVRQCLCLLSQICKTSKGSSFSVHLYFIKSVNVYYYCLKFAKHQKAFLEIAKH